MTLTTQKPKEISQYQIMRYARHGCKQIMARKSSHFKLSALETSDPKFSSLLAGTINGYLAHRKDAIMLGVTEEQIRELDSGLACSMIDDPSLKSTPLPHLFYESKGITIPLGFYGGEKK